MSSITLCKWVNECDCKCSHHYVWMSKEMWNYVMWVQSIEQSCLYEMKVAMWLNEHWGEWVSECAFLCACTHNHLYSHTPAHAFTCSQKSVLRACVCGCALHSAQQCHHVMMKPLSSTQTSHMNTKCSVEVQNGSALLTALTICRFLSVKVTPLCVSEISTSS